MSNESVLIRYRNWRGRVHVRRIMPIQVWYGATQFHPDPQWLLQALDLESPADSIKDFAMSGILEWAVTDDGKE